MNKVNNKMPLEGITVLDLGERVASMAAAMIMGDMGASVIRAQLQNTRRDRHITPAMRAVLNRNKKVVEVDPFTESGAKDLKRLAKSVDVVIAAETQDQLGRLGLDVAALKAENPELIVITVPGFSQNDLKRANWVTSECIIAATCGAFTDMGFNRVLMGVNPSFSPLPLGSAYAATLAATSAVLALFAKEKTGLGDVIEVPVAAALMEGLSYSSIKVSDMPARYRTPRELEIERRRNVGETFDMSYDVLQEYLDPFYRTYKCLDGRYFYCVTPSHPTHARRCLQALGLYDELVAEGLPEIDNLYTPQSSWNTETALGVYPLSEKWARIISQKMKGAFATKTSGEWGKIFGEGMVPGAPHRSTEEWVQDPHSLEAGLIVEVKDTEFGVMKQPGPVVWFEEHGTQATRFQPAETVDLDQALQALADKASRSQGSPSHASKSDPQAGWLEGVRILDLTNVIAGPHSTATLARFGADVIKIDPVKPKYEPSTGLCYTFICGAGKQSLLIDMLSDDGREAFHTLVKSADMVVINAPDRQVVPLGLDEKTLLDINPDILFCRLDCFGGPFKGPKTDYIGYDDIIQANSGIMSRFGGAETPEEHAHLGTLDVNCGFAGGLAMSLSLLHRARTGQTSRSRTSLSAVANLLQLPYSFDYENRKPFNEPSGREVLGHDDWSHFYETSDGWVYLDASPEELDLFTGIKDFAEIKLQKDMKPYFTDIFKSQSSEYWESGLQGQGIAIAQTNAIAKLRQENSRTADGTVNFEGSFSFSIYNNHPSGLDVTTMDPCSIRPQISKVKAIQPTEKFGHSTRKILSSIGYDDAKINNFMHENIAAQQWSEEYLPS